VAENRVVWMPRQEPRLDSWRPEKIIAAWKNLLSQALLPRQQIFSSAGCRMFRMQSSETARRQRRDRARELPNCGKHGLPGIRLLNGHFIVFLDKPGPQTLHFWGELRPPHQGCLLRLREQKMIRLPCLRDDPGNIIMVARRASKRSPMGAVEHLKTLCCLGLKPESAMIAVTPLLHEIIPHSSARLAGC
jgi:hypothetical protein